MYPERKKKKNIQRQTALNQEGRYLLMSILKIFSLIQRRKLAIIQLNAVQTATQFFEELKTPVLQIEANLYSLSDKLNLYRNIKSPPILFTNPKTFPIHIKRLICIVKILTSGNTSLSWRNLYSLSVPLRCKLCPVFSWNSEPSLKR